MSSSLAIRAVRGTEACIDRLVETLMSQLDIDGDDLGRGSVDEKEWFDVGDGVAARPKLELSSGSLEHALRQLGFDLSSERYLRNDPPEIGDCCWLVESARLDALRGTVFVAKPLDDDIFVLDAVLEKRKDWTREQWLMASFPVLSDCQLVWRYCFTGRGDESASNVHLLAWIP